MRSVFAEGQRVRGDHQHGQLAEQQPEHSHDQAFILRLIQEVGRTVRSRRQEHLDKPRTF